MKQKDFSSKSVNRKLLETIQERLQAEKLPCAVAYDIAQKSCIPMKEIGQTADIAEIKLSKCQIGLFGYAPEKKKITKLERIEPVLKQKILSTQHENIISCENIWKISEELQLNKLHVSCACETLGLKIKHCQLGAF
ncbi:regulatory protein [Candidatus Magnetomorum sp. HK-1]|nr:regulatory protein [Candidatus Magnetomorum sp. HK-1]